eukprot:scaffold30450_cov13-Tisochrysis_lutea.AAC.1
MLVFRLYQRTGWDESAWMDPQWLEDAERSRPRYLQFELRHARSHYFMFLAPVQDDKNQLFLGLFLKAASVGFVLEFASPADFVEGKGFIDVPAYMGSLAKAK